MRDFKDSILVSATITLLAQNRIEPSIRAQSIPNLHHIRVVGPSASVLAGSAAAGGFGLFEQRFQFGHDFRTLEGEVLRLAGIGCEVVELVGRGVGQMERFEAGVVLVAIAAGAGVVEVFPIAATD